jgi:hypothetical protein
VAGDIFPSIDGGAYGVAFFIALQPVATWRTWKLWRGETDLGIFTDRFARAAPVSIGFGWLFWGSGLVLLLAHGTARTVAALIWAVVTIVGLVLMTSVFYRGWPRAFVPPHMRERIGTAEELRSHERPLLRDEPDNWPGGAGSQGSVAVEPREAAIRRVYRDPWAVAGQSLALLIFFAVVAYFYFTEAVSPTTSAIMAGVVVVVGVPSLLAVVKADDEGIRVRTQMGRRARIRWSDIEGFELERGDDGKPHASASLRSGGTLELEPLEGVPLQPRKRRWDWAKRSIAGLSAQLQAARRAG